jgi:hypothetical protein
MSSEFLVFGLLGGPDHQSGPMPLIALLECCRNLIVRPGVVDAVLSGRDKNTYLKSKRLAPDGASRFVT